MCGEKTYLLICSGTMTRVSDASIVEPSDIMASSSGKMEESILDTEMEDKVETNDSRGFNEQQAQNEEIYFKLRFLSEGESDSSTEPTDKPYYRTQTCLSS